MKSRFLLIFLILILVAVVIGWYLISNRSQPIVDTIGPSQNPNISVIVTSPIYGSKIASPLLISGTVPPGWMFEGTFPVKILDSKRNVIATGIGKETTPGSWQSQNPVQFSAQISFNTTDRSGFVLIEKDNPSGLPENDKTFEIPVKF
ncbi:MAG TPA: Gmad2 immunoglobulin-like domain-containing protein [Patescibacteria group bacterium]